MQPKTFDRLLVFWLFFMGYWFFGNLYKEIVMIPNQLFFTYETVKSYLNYFHFSNPVFYFVPFTQLAVVVLILLYVEAAEMEWTRSSEEYASIGKVDYRFTLLNEARKNVPEPPEPQNYYRTDNTSYLEIRIEANFRDVYMVMMNIPGRPEWMPDLKQVKQDTPNVFIGSIHHCTFENYQAIISPLRMTLSDEGIMFAESCQIKELNLSLVHESIFKKIDDKTCGFASRFLNASESPIPKEVNDKIFERMQQMAERLKAYCEKMGEPTLKVNS